MSIRTILISVDGTEASHHALKMGFVIGRAMRSHVDVLHVRADPKDTVPLLGEGMSVAMIEDMMDVADRESIDKAGKARTVFEQAITDYGATISHQPEGEGFSVNWIEETGREDDAVALHGRLVDLIVAPRPTESSDVSANLALNAALFETGRAVLVVPPSGSDEPGNNVVISWNGSAQAARAVTSAMPILKAAETVTVFTVESDRTSSERAPELATYLGWHGIICDTHTLSGPSTSVGPKLMEEVAGVKADMLVMGAYTHSRMRQLILGGVTRHILESARIPVLMAH
jgi:nucleotide-binding universal stress UspA family protein